MTLKAQNPLLLAEKQGDASPLFIGGNQPTMLVVMNTQQSSVFLAPQPTGPLAKQGARWAVLLLHGFTSVPSAVLPWGHALAAAGATVHIPLLSGHGTSVVDLSCTTARQWRIDVQQALDGLFRQGFDHIAVGGLSMGGTLALDAAANRPVDVTFVVNPALSFKPLDCVGAIASSFIHRLVPTVGPLAGDIKKPGVSEQAYDRTPTAAVHQLARLFSTARRRLSRISAPVKLYWSTQDHIVPASSAKTLENNTSSGLFQKVVLDRSYHVATLDFDAEVIHEHSVATLMQLSGASDDS
ncbi:MAG: alpha/beta fold hydrolase [Micrococcaceae bacterium]|nr:alpha/beta fold hydrolase [Micrococcaceae bacterium]